jgi:hypothetical protein
VSALPPDAFRSLLLEIAAVRLAPDQPATENNTNNKEDLTPWAISTNRS